MGTTHKTSILDQKQDSGSVLRMTDVWELGYPILVLVILEDGVVIFLRIIKDH